MDSGFYINFYVTNYLTCNMFAFTFGKLYFMVLCFLSTAVTYRGHLKITPPIQDLLDFCLSLEHGLATS